MPVDKQKWNTKGKDQPTNNQIEQKRKRIKGTKHLGEV